METAASFEVRNAPSSYLAVRAILLPDHCDNWWGGGFPLVARAQPTAKVRRIAVVHPSHPIADLREMGSIVFSRAFFNELHRLAYLENSNIIRTAISLSNGIRLKVEAPLCRDRP
jgi:hypothetical protein